MTGPTPKLWLICALGGLLAVGLADALALFWVYWSAGHTFSGTTSGVWTALAEDASRGILYRPVLSEDGYGGTRYMPLSFLAHGALIQAGLSPTLAGVLWMQATVLAMVALSAVVLVQGGLGLRWAVALAATNLCTSIYQAYLTQVNEDYFAAALSLAALALYLARAPLLAVAFVGAAAVFTKLTALYVPAAILTALLLRRDYARAIGFSASGVLFLALGWLLFQRASGGLLAENLSVALAGGTEGSSYALGFPLRFAEEIFVQNPAIGISLVTAALVWARSDWRDVVSLCFVFVTLATALTFTSRGIAGNHVIPLHAVSVLVIGRGLWSSGWVPPVGLALVLAVAVGSLLPGLPSARKSVMARDEPVVADLQASVTRWRVGDGPIFSLHPGFPPLLGERAFMLDGYNLTNFLQQGGEVAEDFRAKIAAQHFSIAIIERRNHFLGWFEESYAQVDRVGRYLVLVPRGG